jgi:hypothetical protein
VNLDTTVVESEPYAVGKHKVKPDHHRRAENTKRPVLLASAAATTAVSLIVVDMQ